MSTLAIDDFDAATRRTLGLSGSPPCPGLPEVQPLYRLPFLVVESSLPSARYPSARVGSERSKISSVAAASVRNAGPASNAPSDRKC